MSAVLIAVYPDRIQRFCSAVIAAGALFWLADDVPYRTDAIGLLLVAAVLFLGRVELRRADNDAEEIVEPVMYGLAIALFALLIVSTLMAIFNAREIMDERLLIGSPTAIGFVVALLWLVASIFKEHGVPLGRPEALLSFAAIVALGAITRTTPAITATLLMLILGFDRRARSLIALSILFFLAFGTAYYYGLHLTLLQKSGILAASGALCLIASLFVRYRFRAHDVTVSEVTA